jgi:hypothetical protein
VAGNQDDRDKLLLFADFAYNNSLHESTGSTPFRVNHGFDLQVLRFLRRCILRSQSLEEEQASVLGLRNFTRRCLEGEHQRQ